jgi:hypothetical protein
MNPIIASQTLAAIRQQQVSQNKNPKHLKNVRYVQRNPNPPKIGRMGLFVNSVNSPNSFSVKGKQGMVGQIAGKIKTNVRTQSEKKLINSTARAIWDNQYGESWRSAQNRAEIYLIKSGKLKPLSRFASLSADGVNNLYEEEYVEADFNADGLEYQEIYDESNMSADGEMISYDLQEDIEMSADGMEEEVDSELGISADGMIEEVDSDLGVNADGMEEEVDSELGISADGMIEEVDSDLGVSADGMEGYYEETEYENASGAAGACACLDSRGRVAQGNKVGSTREGASICETNWGSFYLCSGRGRSVTRIN